MFYDDDDDDNVSFSLKHFCSTSDKNCKTKSNSGVNSHMTMTKTKIRCD